MFGKDSQCPGEGSKLVLPQYKSEALPIVKKNLARQTRNLEIGWVYPNEFSFPFS
jgi:hypothetical protein